MVKEHRPDVIVLDWMLPSMSGIEVCEALRRNNDTKGIPIIMLSARGEEGDRIQGLDAGADDYMIKPFSPSELNARIRAVFRRFRPVLSEKVMNYSDVRMDLSVHKVWRAEREVHLSPTEFGLLRYLMEHPGRVFSREQLLDAVWGSDWYGDDHVVDVHMGNLRKKLGESGSNPRFIHTVRGVGFRFEATS